MLLGEIVATGDTIGRLTHVATATAIDAYTSGVERHVSLYGDSAPNGVIAAIDLSYFAALKTRKATYVGREEFGADNWDSLTAVAPVKMEYSGSRAVLPYVLSFQSSRYWTQRVAYSVYTHEIGTDGVDVREIDYLHHAGQAFIVGPEHLLIVVVHVEVHPNEQVMFGLGGGRRVSVLGRSARVGPVQCPTVRQAVVNEWLGGQMTGGVPPRTPTRCL
ncbi:hypothetical protein MRX96_052739 [Rhipicephalus microplus]